MSGADAADVLDVLVVGSGPTGLTLAGELALAGVRVAVLDRLDTPNEHSKALGLQPRTVEVLAMRGLLDRVLERSLTQVPDAHFAGLPAVMTYQGWGSRHPYGVIIPQDRVEGIMERALLEDHGIAVRRSHELVDLEQDDEGVTAVVSTPDGQRRMRARYLVGCDGGRSAVRKRLGVAFPGTRTNFAGVVADVTLLRSPEAVTARPRSIRDLLGSDTAQQNGMTWPLVPLQNGLFRVVWGIYGQPDGDQSEEGAAVTEEEVRASVRMRYGDTVEIDEVRWLSRFTDSAYQAERYRVGRVLLAGDAAHVHLPAAGQGLNLGVQDAVNLGWKLAAEVNGWAPEGLLDSYHAERHPVGERVVENTRAQAVLTNPAEEYDGLRSIFVQLLGMPEVNRFLAGMVSGLDIRYPLGSGSACPLLGARMPDLDLELPEGPGRVGDLLRAGRGLLLLGTGGARLAEQALPWKDRVDVVAARELPDCPVDAALVRPDGYVCWTDAGDDVPLTDALGTWFGRP
ncbi:FAD-dependent monooxygenase [Allokutzneria sp. A3M-2-11 16]|uniref:FAD-dependent monooxygenase n=1 Tax=Allokutzneria sp. A3M-2-11 16 TaxID=2962043 RepID=UPI0020B83F06|nr:FAD-dependent monooxygenase [Allokutzneria sp. A3M-2-11 16]MCP3803246.1 FAD-dependent monooxygenase [Allokutzneria sp. A3M-2-11 16]